MPIINQVMVEVLNVVERSAQNNIEARQVPSISFTSSAPPTSTTAVQSPTNSSSGGGNGPTSSPLLFFVALGFGVVFTNLWIIVGVKYCFRYNARNRALRAGDEGEINMENMPTRPHRRRREKKLMTMDEVNERFPLTKYKSWVAARAREGLPTSGGVTAPPSRAGSVRDVDMTETPSSPVDTKHSGRPDSAATDKEVLGSATHTPNKKSLDGVMTEKEHTESGLEALKEVHTTASTVGKGEDDDEDDHIHTAVPPELLTNPGDSCAICIDTLEDDDDIRGLTCGHAFHAGCLDPWLTSRRACCPLCKADYYTPKPRPERTPEELAAEAQRRSGRSNMPQPPGSVWRGTPRLILPGRFMNPPVLPSEQPGARPTGQGRTGRRTRRDPVQANTLELIETTNTGITDNRGVAPVNTSRWRPRISNPFGAISMPALRMPGRGRRAATDGTSTTNPSPSQLEAGVRP
ncbi:hypothetical protein PVAG01_06346 [Phlyctema vagabunda]|uniref:RING-type domain-containing protein n=1 Tax=Phlyctema vagabunda TaxID=108571 RepID=A0ABR4PFU0_9HELO